MNIENRIDEDEKLRNLSKKLVNSKSNDRTTIKIKSSSFVRFTTHESRITKRWT